jgi:hypothetical protein
MTLEGRQGSKHDEAPLVFTLGAFCVGVCLVAGTGFEPVTFRL